MEEDIKKFFKYQHSQETTRRKHVTKEEPVGKDMLGASMAAERSEYSVQDVERINHDLRQFDLNMKYGPVSGMTRTQRWQRAEELHLQPPLEIKAYLSDNRLKELLPNLDDHLWSGLIDMNLKS